MTKNEGKRIAPKLPKARVRRLLAEREPKIVEPGRKALLMKGGHSSQVMNDFLLNMVRMGTL